jgi:hypothetical protein
MKYTAIDGASYKVEYDDGTHSGPKRVSGIEAPEGLSGVAGRSRDELQKLLNSTDIKETIVGKDKYGAEITDLNIDGTSLADKMLASGYTFDQNTKDLDLADFQTRQGALRRRSLLLESIDERRGMFSDDEPPMRPEAFQTAYNYAQMIADGGPKKRKVFDPLTGATIETDSYDTDEIRQQVNLAIQPSAADLYYNFHKDDHPIKYTATDNMGAFFKTATDFAAIKLPKGLSDAIGSLSVLGATPFNAAIDSIGGDRRGYWDLLKYNMENGFKGYFDATERVWGGLRTSMGLELNNPQQNATYGQAAGSIAGNFVVAGASLFFNPLKVGGLIPLMYAGTELSESVESAKQGGKSYTYGVGVGSIKGAFTFLTEVGGAQAIKNVLKKSGVAVDVGFAKNLKTLMVAHPTGAALSEMTIETTQNLFDWYIDEEFGINYQSKDDRISEIVLGLIGAGIGGGAFGAYSSYQIAKGAKHYMHTSGDTQEVALLKSQADFMTAKEIAENPRMVEELLSAADKESNAGTFIHSPEEVSDIKESLISKLNNRVKNAINTIEKIGFPRTPEEVETVKAANLAIEQSKAEIQELNDEGWTPKDDPKISKNINSGNSSGKKVSSLLAIKAAQVELAKSGKVQEFKQQSSYIKEQLKEKTKNEIRAVDGVINEAALESYANVQAEFVGRMYTAAAMLYGVSPIEAYTKFGDRVKTYSQLEREHSAILEKQKQGVALDSKEKYILEVFPKAEATSKKNARGSFFSDTKGNGESLSVLYDGKATASTHAHESAHLMKYSVLEQLDILDALVTTSGLKYANYSPLIDAYKEVQKALNKSNAPIPGEIVSVSYEEFLRRSEKFYKKNIESEQLFNNLRVVSDWFLSNDTDMGYGGFPSDEKVVSKYADLFNAKEFGEDLSIINFSEQMLKSGKITKHDISTLKDMIMVSRNPQQFDLLRKMAQFNDEDISGGMLKEIQISYKRNHALNTAIETNAEVEGMEKAGEIKEEDAKTIKERLKDFVRDNSAGVDFKETSRRAFADAILSIKDRIAAKSPALAMRIMASEIKANEIRDMLSIGLLPLAERMDKASQDDQIRFWIALQSTNVNNSVARKIAAKYGAEQEFDKVSKNLELSATILNALGEHIGNIAQYGPRRMKSGAYKKFMQELAERNPERYNEIMQRMEDSGYKGQDTETFVGMIADGIFSRPKEFIFKETNLKTRAILMLEPWMLKYYHSPYDAINFYIQDIANIYKRSYMFNGFGQDKHGNYTRPMNAREFLNNLHKGKYGPENFKNQVAQKGAPEEMKRLYAMLVSGQLDNEQMREQLKGLGLLDGMSEKDQAEVLDLLKAVYFAGYEGRFFGAYRSWASMLTIANPISALSNLEELIYVTWRDGVYHTISGVKAVLGNKPNKVRLEDFSLVNRYVEYANTRDGGRNAFRDFVFKYSGFNFMDKLNKEIDINSAAEKAKNNIIKEKVGAADSETEKFNKKIMLVAEGNAERAAEIKNNIMNDLVDEDVKTYLYSELTDIAPIDLSTTTYDYNMSPNSRIFYMFKTAALKQFSLTFHQIYADYANGDIKKASVRLAELAALLILIGVPIDILKDIVKGKPLENEAISDRAMFSLLKLAMINEKQGYTFAEDGVIAGAVSMLMPPLPVIKEVIHDVKKNENVVNYSSLKYVPVVGQNWYWWFGGGATKNERTRQANRERAEMIDNPVANRGRKPTYDEKSNSRGNILSRLSNFVGNIISSVTGATKAHAGDLPDQMSLLDFLAYAEGATKHPSVEDGGATSTTAGGIKLEKTNLDYLKSEKLLPMEYDQDKSSDEVDLMYAGKIYEHFEKQAASKYPNMTLANKKVLADILYNSGRKSIFQSIQSGKNKGKQKPLEAAALAGDNTKTLIESLKYGSPDRNLKRINYAYNLGYSPADLGKIQIRLGKHYISTLRKELEAGKSPYTIFKEHAPKE